MTDGMDTHKQFIRYALVGIASNAASYLLYFLATWLGVGPKTAMTWLYMLGVLQTFVFNRSWTFRYGGQGGSAFRRYVLLYVLGYVFNLTVMTLFVDRLRWPHQWVMAGLVLLMAIFFFVGQKFWVFRQSPVPELGS